mgnify:CR=1 FL=1
MNMMLLKQILIQHEGLRLFPYKCTAGKLTIGVGRNLETRGITHDEAIYLLENDIDEVLNACTNLPYWHELDEVRQCVVADMVFNLGFNGFRSFRKLNEALAKQDYMRTAYEMKNSHWYKQVGARGVRLVNAMQTGSF